MAFKMTVVGDGFVGKTSLLLRYTQDSVPGEYLPTIFENYAGKIQVDGDEYTVQLLDTSGQEDYDRIRKLSYFNVNCFILCFCVNSASSLKNLQTIWLPEIKKSAPKPRLILVGTKSDLREKEPFDCVKEEDIKKIQKVLKVYKYVECSSVSKEGINEVFETAVRAILQEKRKRRCTLM